MNIEIYRHISMAYKPSFSVAYKPSFSVCARLELEGLLSILRGTLLA
jgi:hypothetical protein